MFYLYEQQANCASPFIRNNKLAHNVIIEANTLEEATNKALYIGIYFNGWESGEDSTCCEERWQATPRITKNLFIDGLPVNTQGIQNIIQYFYDTRIHFKSGLII